MVRRKVVYIFPNLIAEMGRNSDSLQSLSNELGMNYQALSARLRGLKSFELPEITILMKKYRKSFEYLFQSDNGVERKGA
nr:MAG TPA: hypothetical protein [Caudoviricetes sp.]